MKKKIAIAGLGAAAQQMHLPAYAQLPDLEIVGGFDPAIQTAGLGFPLFSSLEEMLEKTHPDILTVAAPPSSHFDLAKLGLLAGCHIFCEKPFMETLEQAAEVIALSKQLKRWVVVNQQFRFMNIHNEAQRRIGSPEFGELLFLCAHQTFYTTPQTEAGWRGEDLRRTCKDFGIHVLDLCRFFFGENPTAISARMPKGCNPDGPDSLNLIQLEFSRDRVAHIILDRVCRGRHRYLDIRLDGSQTCIETHLGGNMEVALGIRGSTRRPYVHADLSMGGYARIYRGEKSKKIASDPFDVFAHATTRLLQSFLKALDSGGVPPCHGDDNRHTLALMLAAYESCERRCPIGMQYEPQAGRIPSER
ncbi:MAG: Gfo/Idh/MocA family oxidoreductase [Acidobacteria bacterium]|nr:Gfo/Idh/MocA family oxidoreductase [Acidobacteriota bacterium]